MAEPFKNELSQARIKVIAQHIHKHHDGFDKKGFINTACQQLDELSLMERNRQIAATLVQFLPDDFKKAQRIIVKALAPVNQQQDKHGLHSWLVIPFAEYVGTQGGQHLKLAMDALTAITPLFSSEWGIRHLLIKQQDATLNILHELCEHKDEHVRRLVSEGSRPRLPWGMQLTVFKNDPSITFALLEKLKNDESDYVRLSVANHLNDMAKDHPDWLQQQLQNWLAPSNPQRVKLIRHACRSLIKAGHRDTLNMLGFKPFNAQQVSLGLSQGKVKFGDALNFELTFSGPPKQDVIVDYAIYFQKANGEQKPKVFKWKQIKLNSQGQFNASKKHSIKPITTRRYYNGAHKLEILLNGQAVASAHFDLHSVV